MQNKPSKPSSRKPQYSSITKYGSIGFQLFAAIFLGVWGGMKMDDWLHTKPWFTVILSLLGITAGLYSVLREFIKPKR